MVTMCLGRLFSTASSRKQKIKFSDFVTFWGSRTYIKLFNLFICEKILLATLINFTVLLHDKFSK